MLLEAKLAIDDADEVTGGLEDDFKEDLLACGPAMGMERVLE